MLQIQGTEMRLTIFSYEDVNVGSSNLAKGVFPEHKYNALFRVLGCHIPNNTNNYISWKEFLFIFLCIYLRC